MNNAIAVDQNAAKMSELQDVTNETGHQSKASAWFSISTL